MNEKLIEAAETAIERYLAEHPKAADTIEGIHCYWIQWEGVPEMMAVTEAALLRLEQAGLVERTKVANRDVWHRMPAPRPPRA